MHPDDRETSDALVDELDLEEMYLGDDRPAFLGGDLEEYDFEAL